MLYVLGLTITSALLYGPTILALYLFIGGLLIGMIPALTLGPLTGAIMGAIMGAILPQLSASRAAILGCSICTVIVILILSLLVASGNANIGPTEIVAFLAYIGVGGFLSRHLYWTTQ